MTTEAKTILVIGAGIVGVSTAIWLQRAGQTVTLLDRVGPAGGTSYGNAGVLASGSVIPVTVPGLLKKAPGMLFSPDQPLFLKWRYLPKLIPFLRRYLSHGTEASVDKISQALTTLLHDSPDQHLALARDTPAEAFVKPGSYLFGYADKAAFDADSFGWKLRTRLGIPYREMDPAALSAYDPALTGRFGYAVECTNHGLISDPGAYVTALAAHFEASGGKIVIGELLDFTLDGDQSCTAVTDAGDIPADAYVLATGAWSGKLAAKLGITVLLESERGYHIEFVNPSITLKSPIMVASGKFVASSMDGRLRCAGVVEFGGLDAAPSKAPFDLLKRNIATLFPDLTYDRIDEWMGHRPATADSVPVIGPTPKAKNVYVGYGHHHVGLTGGPKTGRWLAQMITQDQINTDLTAFSPERQI